MHYRDKKADLISQWPKNFRKGVIISLAAFLLLALTFITIEVAELNTPEYQQTIEIEQVQQTKQQIEKKEPPKPKIAEVIATEEETPDTVTIGETELEVDSYVPPPPPEDEIVDFYVLESPPTPLAEPQPKYPSLARKGGVEGVVIVQVIIGLDGKVERAEVIDSDPEGFFEEAALSAARQWEFTPAMQRDKAVKVRYQIPFRFKLN